MGEFVNLDLTQLVAIAATLGWASGLRLYAVVFLTGLAGWLGWVTLPGDLHALAHPVVIGAAGLMLFLEFLVDKIPGLDSIWDAVHTFVRIPAGAALAGAVFGGDPASWVTAAALMGGTLAATSHAAKLTTRASANTSPEPFSNIALSLLGDGAVPAMLWLSWTHPVIALVVLAAVTVLSLVVLWVLWCFLAGLLARMRGGLPSAALEAPNRRSWS